MKIIKSSNSKDIKKIQPYLEKFNLDAENMDNSLFFIAKVQNKMVGFGRIKNHKSFYELASVAVLEDYRGQGIGKKIVESILESLKSQEVWLSTVIPDFFEKLGFYCTEPVPEEIILKNRKLCKKFNKDPTKANYMMKRNEPN